MNKDDLGNVLATQLIECISNRKYGYMSLSNPSFSHLNEAGKELMGNLISSLVQDAQKVYQNDVKERAEAMMMDTLKK